MISLIIYIPQKYVGIYILRRERGNIHFMSFIREYYIVIYYYNIQWKRNFNWFDNNMQIKIKLFCVNH